MDGPVEFHDCDDVTLLIDGGSDDAGFVQVIRGKVDDPARLKAILADADGLREMRPDIVGASLAVEPDGTFTETVAFTSEEAARSGSRWRHRRRCATTWSTPCRTRRSTTCATPGSALPDP